MLEHALVNAVPQKLINFFYGHLDHYEISEVFPWRGVTVISIVLHGEKLTISNRGFPGYNYNLQVHFAPETGD